MSCFSKKRVAELQPKNSARKAKYKSMDDKCYLQNIPHPVLIAHSLSSWLTELFGFVYRIMKGTSSHMSWPSLLLVMAL